jgi:hypothetical protein
LPTDPDSHRHFPPTYQQKRSTIGKEPSHPTKPTSPIFLSSFIFVCAKNRINHTCAPLPPCTRASLITRKIRNFKLHKRVTSSIFKLLLSCSPTCFLLFLPCFFFSTSLYYKREKTKNLAPPQNTQYLITNFLHKRHTHKPSCEPTVHTLHLHPLKNKRVSEPPAHNGSPPHTRNQPPRHIALHRTFPIDLPAHTHAHAHAHTYPQPKSSLKKMGKDSSFRMCIAFLLMVQIACWTLTLLDLLHPGKPYALIRTTMDLVSLYFSRQSSAALLSYRDIKALMY